MPQPLHCLDTLALICFNFLSVATSTNLQMYAPDNLSQHCAKERHQVIRMMRHLNRLGPGGGLCRLCTRRKH